MWFSAFLCVLAVPKVCSILNRGMMHRQMSDLCIFSVGVHTVNLSTVIRVVYVIDYGYKCT